MGDSIMNAAWCADCGIKYLRKIPPTWQHTPPECRSSAAIHRHGEHRWTVPVEVVWEAIEQAEAKPVTVIVGLRMVERPAWEEGFRCGRDQLRETLRAWARTEP